jgi:hypothetical protein
MPGNLINEKQSVVDYSYYVLLGVHNMSFNGYKDKLALDLIQTLHQELITEYIIIGKYISTGGAEVTIKCKERKFYLPADAKLNEPINPFLPKDTPNFKRNMEKERVEAFFSYENLPDEIRALLGRENYTLTWY